MRMIGGNRVGAHTSTRHPPHRPATSAVRSWMKRVLASSVGVACVLFGARSALAADVTFDAGSYVVPMDIDYQDAGMLSAFGLLDKLLRGGVPIA